jgi:hypothetical protein
MKETFNPKKAGEERGARIDAQRGYGTYNPLAGSDRPSIPGFPNVRNTRENYERKANTKLPGIENNPWKTARDMPGSGL